MKQSVCSGHTSDDCIGGCNSRDNSFNHTWKTRARNLMNQKLEQSTHSIHDVLINYFKILEELNPRASSCTYLVWVCKWLQWCWTPLLAPETSGTPTECVQDYHHPEPHHLHRYRKRLHVSISLDLCNFPLLILPGHRMDIFKENSIYCNIYKYLTVKLLRSQGACSAMKQNTRSRLSYGSTTDSLNSQPGEQVALIHTLYLHSFAVESGTANR